ncbi:MAG: glycosyltransferase family 2 protein [Clostridia bacterium]|nr:glycosyltransferase family 2 protein [Clostridia bacterium]
MTKVSVIVPIYNVEKYLKKCLDSLVGQTLKDIEILAINDGSPDNSQKIVDEYVKKYDNIKSYIKENGGQSDARNFGLEKAKGDYIVFVDADDWIDKNFLKVMYENAKTHNSDIVICDFEEIYENGVTKIKKEIDKNIEDIQKAYMIAMPGFCNKMLKKDFLRKIDFKFFNGIFYEDLAIYPIVAAKTNNISYVNKALYKYRIRQGSTMNQQKNTKRLLDIFKVFEYIESGMESISNKENFYEEMEYIYINHLLHAASLRFIKYKDENENLIKISKIMKTKYPKWRKNKYYKKENWKYKLICYLLYKNKFNLVRNLIKQ